MLRQIHFGYVPLYFSNVYAFFFFFLFARTALLYLLSLSAGHSFRIRVLRLKHFEHDGRALILMNRLNFILDGRKYVDDPTVHGTNFL